MPQENSFSLCVGNSSTVNFLKKSVNFQYFYYFKDYPVPYFSRIFCSDNSYVEKIPYFFVML